MNATLQQILSGQDVETSSLNSLGTSVQQLVAIDLDLKTQLANLDPTADAAAAQQILTKQVANNKQLADLILSIPAATPPVTTTPPAPVQTTPPATFPPSSVAPSPTTATTGQTNVQADQTPAHPTADELKAKLSGLTNTGTSDPLTGAGTVAGSAPTGGQI